MKVDCFNIFIHAFSGLFSGSNIWSVVIFAKREKFSYDTNYRCHHYTTSNSVYAPVNLNWPPPCEYVGFGII